MMNVVSNDKVLNEGSRDVVQISRIEALVVAFLLVWAIGSAYDIVLSACFKYIVISGTKGVANVDIISEFRSVVFTRLQMGWLMAAFMAPSLIWRKYLWLMFVYMTMCVVMCVFIMIVLRVSPNASVWSVIAGVTGLPITEWTKPFVTYMVVKRMMYYGLRVGVRSTE